jgi:hypothetical protein
VRVLFFRELVGSSKLEIDDRVARERSCGHSREALQEPDAEHNQHGRDRNR